MPAYIKDKYCYYLIIPSKSDYIGEHSLLQIFIDIVCICAPDSDDTFNSGCEADLNVENTLVNADAGRINIFSVNNRMKFCDSECSMDERRKD